MRTVIGAVALVAAYLVYDVVINANVPIVGRLLFVLVAASLGVLALWLEGRRRRWLTRFRDDEARRLVAALSAHTPVEGPMFLYLRPFASTGQLTIDNPKVVRSNAAMPGSYAPATLEAESELRDALDQFGTLIGLGRPGEHYGAGRLATTEAEWQSRVLLLAERATLIFLLPSANRGTSWEIQQLRARGHLAKTVFVMPPASTSGAFSPADEWERVRAAFAQAALDLPPYRPEGALFSLHAPDPRSTVSPWMTGKRRRLRVGLQRLAGAMGVPLTPRFAAASYTDAPPPPALAWIVVFSLMAFNAAPGWPSWPSGEMFGGREQQMRLASWGLSAMALGFVLYLLLQSAYGHLNRRALALLVGIAIWSASPFWLMPGFSRLDRGGSFPPSILIKGSIIGLLIAILLRRLIPQPFKLWRVVLLTTGCLAVAQVLQYAGLETIQPVVGIPIIPSASLMAGLFFGLGLMRATGWNPMDPVSGVRAPLRVEGFAIGWALVGYGLSHFLWGTSGHEQLWIALALGGAVAQCVGWFQQGRPLSLWRCAMFVAGWGLMARGAVAISHALWSWLDPAALMTSFPYPAPFSELAHEGFTGLLIGAAGGALGVRIHKGGSFFSAAAGRQAALLGAGLGAIAMLGRVCWDIEEFRGFSVWTPPLALLLAVLMASAAYLEVRLHRAETQSAALPAVAVSAPAT